MQNHADFEKLLTETWPSLAEGWLAGRIRNLDLADLAPLYTILTQLSVEHIKKLNKYAELLVKWNRAYNLIGKSTESEIHLRHLVDSLQLISWLESGQQVLDIGSGAGLPAVPLAIASGAHIYACEPLQKRCLFLNQVKRELELDVYLQVWQKNVQEIDQNEYQFDIITARAVADIQKLVTWGLPLLKEGGKFVLLKGESAEKEIAEFVNSQVTFLIKSSITNPDGKIVVIQPK